MSETSLTNFRNIEFNWLKTGTLMEQCEERLMGLWEAKESDAPFTLCLTLLYRKQNLDVFLQLYQLIWYIIGVVTKLNRDWPPQSCSIVYSSQYLVFYVFSRFASVIASARFQSVHSFHEFVFSFPPKWLNQLGATAFPQWNEEKGEPTIICCIFSCSYYWCSGKHWPSNLSVGFADS